MYRNFLILCLLMIFCFFSNPFAQIQFTPFTISISTQSTESLFICDLDGDGDNDILGAAAENDHDVISWRNDGGDPIQWTKIIIDNNFSGAGAVYAADLNNDTYLDVIAGAKLGNQVAWWENSGGNPVTWTKRLIQSNYAFPHEVYAFDLDEDGNKDVLEASSTLGEITWWKNHGGNPITWTKYVVASNFTQAKSVYVGDFNNDNLPDIVGAALNANKINWWENDGNTPVNWIAHTVTDNFAGAHHVQAADIDDDGFIDILGAGYFADEIAWWKNEGGNPIQWTRYTIEQNFPSTCIAMAIDLDNDNDLDVIATAQDGNEVAWWRNDGGNPISWVKYVIDGNFNRIWPMYAGDLDADGDMDVVAASGYAGNNEVRWYRNELITEVEETQSQGTIYNNILFDNYPNPLNPSTSISYSIPKEIGVRLEVLNTLGEQVDLLVDEIKSEGLHTVVWDARNVSSGIYYYKMQAGDFIQIKKMVLMK